MLSKRSIEERSRYKIEKPVHQVLPPLSGEIVMTQPASSSAETNRREFLKSSSMAAVGAGVLGSLGSLPGAFAANDDTIKIGLIGCGGRGTGAAVQACS